MLDLVIVPAVPVVRHVGAFVASELALGKVAAGGQVKAVGRGPDTLPGLAGSLQDGLAA